jgi:hypothetical protein
LSVPFRIAAPVGLLAQECDLFVADGMEDGLHSLTGEAQFPEAAGGLDELRGEEVENSPVDDFAGDVLVARNPGPHSGLGFQSPDGFARTMAQLEPVPGT